MSYKSSSGRRQSIQLKGVNILDKGVEFDICSFANPFGPLEEIKVVPKLACAFLNFVRGSDAESFVDTYGNQTITIGKNPYVTVHWGRTLPPLPADSAREVMKGATRCLLLTNLPPSLDEHRLNWELDRANCRYGGFESVNFYSDKPEVGGRSARWAVVNFLSIRAAMAAKTALHNRTIDDTTIQAEYTEERPAVTRPQQPKPPHTPIVNRPCYSWQRTRTCRYEERCMFQHSDERRSLSPPPSCSSTNSTPYSSERHQPPPLELPPDVLPSSYYGPSQERRSRSRSRSRSPRPHRRSRSPTVKVEGRPSVSSVTSTSNPYS